MAIYWLASDTPRRYASYKWKAPLVFVAFVVIAIVCGHFEFFWEQRYPQLPDIPSLFYPIAVIGAIFSFGFIVAVHYALRNLKTQRIRITPDGILQSHGGLNEIFLPREEITGFTERKNAIVVRTADPRRRIVVTPDLERYADFRSELVFMGIDQISDRGNDQLWACGMALVSISTLLLFFTKTGHRFVYESVFVISSLSGLSGLFYAAWRNRRLKEGAWRLLLPASLLVAAGITFALARNAGPLWQKSLLRLGCLLGITLGVIGLIEWGYRRLQKKN